jgi:hypothetical protein
MASNGSVGKFSWIMLAFGAGACWYACEHWNTPAPKAAAAPGPVRTVIVHTVTQAASGPHSPVSGTDIVLMVIASLVVVLVLALNRRA